MYVGIFYSLLQTAAAMWLCLECIKNVIIMIHAISMCWCKSCLLYDFRATVNI